MQCIKTSTYFHNYSIKKHKSHKHDKSDSKHSGTTDERQKSSTSSKTISEHKHTSGNSAVLLSDTMVCVLHIFNHFYF